MKKSLVKLFFLSVCLVLPVSAAIKSKKGKDRTVDCSKKLNEAILLYKNKRYSQAQLKLSDIKVQCNGSPVMDSVLYYLGMSDIMAKKYIEARTEMELLVQDYPQSAFFNEAKFRVPYCVYKQSSSYERDQKETEEAIRLFRDFLTESPSTGWEMDSARFYYKEAIEKMAKKEFQAAKFYERVERYEAAVVYYRTFLNDYPESKFSDEAQLNMLQILVRLERNAEAQEALDEIITQNRNTELIKKAKEIVQKGSSQK
ncbi:MAG TPA: outer membrane protein assembly factor BamD [Chitinispirillaceae bacterium]|nr:outer membrane protein assembly factor BamD [Chitinispirillaceae bacterium]